MKNKITLKNVLRTLTISIITVFSVWCVCEFINYNLFTETEYIDCGVIISKSNDEVVIKHGTSTELFLNIEFDKAGFKSVKCEPTTYFKNKVGDNICFMLTHQEYEKADFKYMIVILGGMISVIILLVLIAMFVRYISPESWEI